MGVRTEAQNLRQRTEQLSAELASALDARDNLERDLADARNKEKGSIAKLELKLRECEELRLEINKRTQDAKVVTSMLDKTSRELRELKKNNAEQGLLHNTADEVKALKGEHAALLDLAKSFMRGHAEVKKIIREAQHAGYGEEADAADLTRYISMLGDARQGTEQEVKTLKMGFLNMGHAKLWEELAKELGREKI